MGDPALYLNCGVQAIARLMVHHRHEANHAHLASRIVFVQDAHPASDDQPPFRNMLRQTYTTGIN